MKTFIPENIEEKIQEYVKLTYVDFKPYALQHECMNQLIDLCLEKPENPFPNAPGLAPSVPFQPIHSLPEPLYSWIYVSSLHLKGLFGCQSCGYSSVKRHNHQICNELSKMYFDHREDFEYWLQQKYVLKDEIFLDKLIKSSTTTTSQCSNDCKNADHGFIADKERIFIYKEAKISRTGYFCPDCDRRVTIFKKI